MTRRSRDDAAAGLAERELATHAIQGPVLIVEDPSERLANAAVERGLTVERWDRRARGGRVAAPWPPEGPFALVALRLPRAKDELEMAVHAAVSRLAPGGELWIYGTKDEGVRSAGARVTPLLGAVRTLAIGGHGRLLGAVHAGELQGLRGTLDAWRCEVDLELPGGRRRWVSYPGVFAHGRLDPGSAFLLEHLPPFPPGARALDYGAGSGVLAAGMLDACPDARVTLLEADAVAGAAATENVPGGRTIVGDNWSALPADACFDVIVANPPYHRGKDESLDAVATLARGAAARLTPGGVMRLVVQRRLSVEPLLADRLAGVTAVADGGAYRVWEGRAARPR